jgi:hypothetical protein
VYPFAFETLTAVMRLGNREFAEHSRFHVELFEPHLEVLLRSLSWVEGHELVHEGIHGWRSNTVLPGPQPQAWATAMALCFVRALDVLLQRIVQERLLKEFSATRFPKSTQASLTLETWCPDLADSTTPLAGARQSLKKLLFDHLIEPRLPQASPDAIRRLRWSAVFFGPPGTAKTRLASEIAKALSWPLVTIETSDLLALGVDRMAHQAGVVFRKFEQLREVVIFIDEVEEFVRKRAVEDDRESRLTTTAMLTLIQRLRNLKRSILIVATNHVDTFDPAIIRPGRFDLLVLINPPSVTSKIRLWKEVFNDDVAAIADDVFRERFNIVERFTFIEWKTFLQDCNRENAKQMLTRERLGKLVDEARSGLTIDNDEWGRWVNRESRVTQGE